MQPQIIDPLEVESLPSDPRVMALRLLGMTAAEMKDIDRNITGGSNNISGLRLNVDKLVNEFNNVLAPVPTAAPVFDTQPLPQLNVQSIQPQQVVVTPTVPQSPNDPNQLEFDFYKKIAPEDIHLELKNINRNIKNLEDKLNLILKNLDTKKN
jgi:hypothetical protein